MPSNALYRGYKKADEYVTNALIGAGYGIRNQMEGLYQMAAHPVNTLQGIGAMVTNPREAGQAIWQGVKDYGTMATSGPLGLGQAVGENLPLTMRRAPSKMDMTVYHGSPHNFDAFDISKIGTGEGAQAYGHGLYVAESPGVAKQYKLAGSDGAYKIEGAPARPKADPLGPGRDAAVAYDDAMAKAKSLGLDAAITYYQDQVRFFPQYADEYARPLAQLQQMKASGAKSTPVGSLYHVDIPDAAVAKMLDWDKPLSEQPEAVKEALRGSDVAPDESVWDQYTGRQLYEGEMQASGPYNASGWANSDSQKAVSEKLLALGIPGIRYLDGGSRAAGDGSRNYVVFDDKLLKILKKE